MSTIVPEAASREEGERAMSSSRIFKIKPPGGSFRSALLLMVIACVSVTSAHAAGRVFYDNFESGNTNQWSTDEPHNKCVVVSAAHDTGAPHSGNKMLECNWNGTVAWNDPASYSTVVLPQESWKYSREFLIRLWLRYDADVDHVNGNKVLRLYPWSNDHLDSFYVAAHMDWAGQPLFLYWEWINGSPGPEFWGQGTHLGDTMWHKLEIYVKHNETGKSDGALKVWLDGALVQQAANIASIGPGSSWGPLYLVSNWTTIPGWEHDANNHVYWDDVEIFSDLGTGGVGQMSDASISSSGVASAARATVPDPPNGVTVQ